MNNNPLIILIVWFVFNLIVKSLKDKKKIEEARQKRAQQLSPTTKNVDSKRQTLQQELRRTVSTLREEIEKEVQNERWRKSVIPQQQTYGYKNEDNLIKSKEQVKWNMTSPKETKANVQDEPIKEGSKPSISIQNDILRGIIFSEILSEPKSIKYMKRSM